MKTYWYEVRSGEYEGEEFFIEAVSSKAAAKIATELFPNEDLHCFGSVSEFEAEMMGLDTY